MSPAERLVSDLVHSATPGAAVDHLRTWTDRYPGAGVVTAPPSDEWPFLYPLAPAVLPAGAFVVWAPQLHEAFVNHQGQGTRLVTTHASFLLQVWLDALADRADGLILGTADPDVLRTHAPEAVARRGPAFAPGSSRSDGAAGPWEDARIQIVETTSASASGVSEASYGETSTGLLVRAFRATSAAERLSLCVRALDQGRTAPALLAAASTCMEVNDLDAAARDLDEALALAPEWAAPHFERGKLWLRVDDMERAGACFREATVRMPALTSAWANLGATLGELDRPEQALAAFERALALEPDNPQALNNVGVVSRELGQLVESEAALRRVIELSPNLAFGYYNLGHTLFLQGRYQAALSAYAEGQRRDPERNPVQASRLALCRLATGDPQGAVNDLRQTVRGLPREYKEQLLGDTHAIAWALLTHRPDLAGWQQVNDWLTKELKS